MSRAKIAVVTDFDGTVTSFDVGDHAALKFGLASRAEVLASYNEGASVSKWMKKVYGRKGVPGPSAIAAFVRREAKPRRGFLAMASFCRRNSIPLEIASGGLDVYITPLLSAWRLTRQIKLSCGRAIYKNGVYSVRYPFSDTHTLDKHKQKAVLRLQKKGYRVVFCGDGTSDYSAASSADFVFARYKLYQHCRQKGVKAHSLRDFDGVLRLLSSEAPVKAVR